MGRKVAVAMSGGVDSSVAAYLIAKKYGKKNVFGVTLKLFDGEHSYLQKANKVCEELGIKHSVVDVRKSFKKEIIDYFVSEYKKGKTPNPCVKCNRIIKFGELFQAATKLGADLVATGHYANIKLKGGAYRLYKGGDKTKDQSYFLYRLTQYELAHAIFPLGNVKKTKTKKIAKKLGLSNIEVESQEVCFVETTAKEFLKDKIKAKKGSIVDIHGNKVGTHAGAHLYTIGQRKGLGVSSTDPYYVVEVNIGKNEVIVGREKHLYRKRLSAFDTNWISGKAPERGLRVKAKIRYAMTEVKAQVFPTRNRLDAEFTDHTRAVTPGQSIVFYKGSEVLGGGIID